jgi:hypothetical protein
MELNRVWYHGHLDTSILLPRPGIKPRFLVHSLISMPSKAGITSALKTPRCYRRVSDALNKHTGVYETDYIKGVRRC